MKTNPPPAAPEPDGHAPGLLRAVIVDDEPTARRGVRMLLKRDRGVEIVGEAANGAEAINLINRTKPDLLFLDVQMPGGDGFEVLARMDKAAAPVVVFVTAYDEHALHAFEVNAVDYLLKPYDDARFTAALQRAKDEVHLRRADHVNTQLSQLIEYLQHEQDRILLKSSGEIFFLKAEQIDWIEAEGDYMKFHVAGHTHLMRETMAHLEARLDSKRFIRIHRSAIVNIDRVQKLSPSFLGEYAVILQDGTKLKLSRGYHERIADLVKLAR